MFVMENEMVGFLGNAVGLKIFYFKAGGRDLMPIVMPKATAACLLSGACAIVLSI